MSSIDLKKWASENNVEERTIKGFWKAFDNYVLDCPDEVEKYYGVLDKSKIYTQLDRICLVSDWNNNDNEYIFTVMPIIYKGKKIGSYELKFKTTGVTFDDCLVNEILAE